MKITLRAIAVLGAGAGVAGAQEPIPYQNATAVQNGQALYVEHCAACHGEKLEGEPDWRSVKDNGLRPAPPHDETGHTWHHSDAQLFDLTKNGITAVLARRGLEYESDMIGFGDVMSDAQILEVLAYIKSTWPEQIVETHNKINAGQ